MGRTSNAARVAELPTTKVAALKAGAKKIQVEVPTPSIITFDIKVVGETPLIMHNFGEKAKREMADNQQRKAKAKKAPKNPAAEYEAAFYRLADGRPALPVAAFRRAMIDGASFVENVTKVLTRGSFTILADDPRTNLVALSSCSKPHMREDVVRLNGTTTDLRYRPQFDEWEVLLTFSMLENTGLSPSQLVHLLQVAGYSVGIGEWRPQKNGDYGRFLLKV